MSYSWYRTGTASVVNGSNVVRFQAAQITTSSTKPVVGDAFILNGSNDIYEVIFIGSDATGEFIRIHKVWAGATANNQQYAMMRLASGTQNNKLVAMAAAAINQKQISLDDMYEWYTSTADTVDFAGPDGSIVTLTTYRKLANEISSVGGNAGNITIVADNIASVNSVSTSIAAVKNVSGNMTSVNGVNSNIASVKGVNDNMPIVKNVNDNMASVKNVSDNMDTIKSINLSSVAMSQSQFEAIRAANNEEFAASGFVHFGKHLVSVKRNNVNDGLWTIEDMPNRLLLGYASSFAVGASKAKLPTANIAGVQFNVANVNDSGDANTIKFPQAPDGKTTYNKSTGAIVTHATVAAAFNAQAADPANVEVVTDRVDMWGFEAWLEEVDSTNPFVYPNGLIQSQATTMDGITTSASARPVTYYAVFDGDTGSKGKGVNFFTLTDAQKKKVLGNHQNNLYYLDDGRLVQWRLRQKTYQGFGNGDWFNIESQKGNLQFKSGLAVNSTLGSSWVADSQNIGVFKDSSGSLFLVCGTVNRLNQGGYHLSFNPSGAGKYLDGNDWFNTSRVVQSTSSTFSEALFGGIGSHSGRPDGRFYDAIYADGFGGVCRDMRYSANGLTPTDFAEADQRVKNGAYRGFEKAVFSKVVFANNNTGNTDYSGTYGTRINFPIGTLPILYTNGKSLPHINNIMYNHTLMKAYFVKRAHYSESGADRVYLATADGKDLPYDPNISNSHAWSFVSGELSTSSIGGSFLQTDVIGNPANILATPQLANGWQGSWLPWIPNNTASPAQTRKILSIHNQVYSDNNGASWTNGVWGFNSATNSEDTGGAVPANLVVIRPYQAFAKQTKPSVNAVVYGGQSGVGDVFAVTDHYKTAGGLLAESATGLVLKSNVGVTRNSKTLLSRTVGGDGRPESAGGHDGISHQTLTISSPANASAGFKCVNYPTALNQQGLINYAYTELKHNGTNWGDDSKVTIVDNQSTKTDLNGNTVLVGTAQLNEPLGWIKNKV